VYSVRSVWVCACTAVYVYTLRSRFRLDLAASISFFLPTKRERRFRKGGLLRVEIPCARGIRLARSHVAPDADPFPRLRFARTIKFKPSGLNRLPMDSSALRGASATTFPAAYCMRFRGSARSWRAARSSVSLVRGAASEWHRRSLLRSRGIPPSLQKRARSRTRSRD